MIDESTRTALRKYGRSWIVQFVTYSLLRIACFFLFGLFLLIAKQPEESNRVIHAALQYIIGLTDLLMFHLTDFLPS